MIPTKTYPLSAIMGEEVTDKERIAELEAQLKHCEGHAAELEAENKALREAMDKYSEDEVLLKGAERLAIATAALKRVRDYQMTPLTMVDAIREALAQIEEEK